VQLSREIMPAAPAHRRGLIAPLAARARAVIRQIGDRCGVWGASMDGAACPYRSRRYAYRRGRRWAAGGASLRPAVAERTDRGAQGTSARGRGERATVSLAADGGAEAAGQLAWASRAVPREPALSHLRFLRWLCQTGRLAP
jgi:hypothetical protein